MILRARNIDRSRLALFEAAAMPSLQQLRRLKLLLVRSVVRQELICDVKRALGLIRKRLYLIQGTQASAESGVTERGETIEPGFPFWILASPILRSFSLERKPFLTAGTHRAGPKCFHWTLSFSEGDNSSVGKQFFRHSSELQLRSIQISHSRATVLPARQWQRPDPVQHVAEQLAVQMSLGQQQPVIARMLH